MDSSHSTPTWKVLSNKPVSPSGISSSTQPSVNMTLRRCKRLSTSSIACQTPRRSPRLAIRQEAETLMDRLPIKLEPSTSTPSSPVYNASSLPQAGPSNLPPAVPLTASAPVPEDPAATHTQNNQSQTITRPLHLQLQTQEVLRVTHRTPVASVVYSQTRLLNPPVAIITEPSPHRLHQMTLLQTRTVPLYYHYYSELPFSTVTSFNRHTGKTYTLDLLSTQDSRDIGTRPTTVHFSPSQLPVTPHCLAQSLHAYSPG